MFSKILAAIYRSANGNAVFDEALTLAKATKGSLMLGQGHDVVVLTRSPEKAKALVEQSVELAIADVFDAEAVKAAFIHAQPKVVIEQLTALPKTYTGESMSAVAPLNQRLRQEGGANVLAAAQAAGVQRLRGVLNAKARRELNFQPRPLEWMVDTTVACAS